MPLLTDRTTSTESIPAENYRSRRGVLPPRRRSPNSPPCLLGLCLGIVFFGMALALPSEAQDWGRQADGAWAQPATPTTNGGLLSGWSLRAGIGFIDDPTALLLNIEAPYAFDRWVSAGPMFQIGLDDNNTIVAPTANLTLTIPDLPGEDLDWIQPFVFAGIGFAYIEDDNKQNDDSSAGFLVDFGFGLEFQVSESFYLGSQMIFNFLPEETLGQDFFYGVARGDKAIGQIGSAIAGSGQSAAIYLVVRRQRQGVEQYKNGWDHIGG